MQLTSRASDSSAIAFCQQGSLVACEYEEGMEIESKMVNSEGKSYLSRGLESQEDRRMMGRVEELPNNVGSESSN